MIVDFFFFSFYWRFLLHFQQRESKWAIKSSVVPFSIENRTEYYIAISYCLQALSQPAIDFGGKGNLLNSIWDTHKIQTKEIYFGLPY